MITSNAKRMHSQVSRTATLLCLVLASASGCGQGGPQRAAVSGSVQLNGQPVASGSIAFYPAEGAHGPSAGGSIENGQYRIAPAKGVVVGKSRVEINSLKKSGRMVPDPMNSKAQMEEYVESIPPKYNSESTLIKDIVAGDNKIDFDLTSK